MNNVLRVIAIELLLAASALAGDWPQFRGPTGLGYTPEHGLPLTWGGAKQENVIWKAPLVGQGCASPIVWGDNVFVCTTPWPAVPGQPERSHHVLCYGAHDGKLRWDRLVPPGPVLITDHRAGPGGGYANSTPATDGKFVYCVFSSSVLAALDFEGNIKWKKDLVPHEFDVTIGASPILFQDTVLWFFPERNPAHSKLTAFDKATGEVKWEQPMPHSGFAHSTPLVIDVQGKPQLLIADSAMSPGAEALTSYDPTNGKKLWWCWGEGESASPAYGSGIVYFDSGRGGPGVAVDPTGTGDVSATHTKWKVRDVQEALGSPIVVDGRVYRLHEPGVLKCWDAASGTQLYSERLPGIGTTRASPVADPDGHIFFANAGKSVVIQAGPTFKILATNDLSDPNGTSPAVAGGRMFLLGTKNLYCIGQQDR